MPITQDTHNAMARAADRAMKALEAFIEGLRDDISAGLTGPDLVEKILVRISSVPRMAEEREMATKAIDRYKFTSHSNRRRAARGRAERGTATPEDEAFLQRVRHSPQRKTVYVGPPRPNPHKIAVENAIKRGMTYEEMKLIDPKALVAWYGPGSPAEQGLHQGESFVREDGAIISEIAAPKPPVSQAELNVMLDNASAMLAGSTSNTPSLLARIPKAPATIAAEEAARQALENGGGED